MRLDLYNALFIPNLQYNLMSVSRIESAGLSISFSNGHVKVRDKQGKLIIQGKRIEGLYYLDLYLDKTEKLLRSLKSMRL